MEAHPYHFTPQNSLNDIADVYDDSDLVADVILSVHMVAFIDL